MKNNIKLLLVEDDEDKREQLISFIVENIQCDFIETKSFHSALKEIKHQNFDLIFLDMTMPTFDITAKDNGGRSQPFGGEMILSEITRRRISSKVIIVTQFDFFGKNEEEITLKDLDSKLAIEFPENYVGAVQYSITYMDWKVKLLNFVNKTGLL